MTVEQVGMAVTIEAQLERFDRNMKASGVVVQTVTDGMDKATKRAATSFDRLERALNPAAASAQRYQRDVERVKVAVDSGAVSNERAAQVLARLGDQYERGAVSASRAATGMGRFSVLSGEVGFRLQNASYQVADFFVQVGSGTSAMRAASQQLPQFLAGFGPMGAIIGAGAATLAALVPALFNTGKEADKSAVKIDAFGMAADNMARLVGGAKDSLDDLTQSYRKLTEAQRSVETTALATQRDTFAKQMEDAAKANRSTIGGIIPNILGNQETEFVAARETLLKIGDAVAERAQVVENTRAAVEALRRAGEVEFAQKLLTNLKDFEEASDRLDKIDARIRTLRQSVQGLSIPPNSLITGSESAASAAYFSDIAAAVDATRESLEEYRSAQKQYRSAGDAYALQVRQLRDLHARGVITAEQYSRAMKDAASSVVAAANKTIVPNSLTTGGASPANAEYFASADAQIAGLREKNEEAFAEAKRLSNQQVSRGIALYNASRTPAEQYADDLKAIAEAERLGKLTAEEATRARAEANRQLTESSPYAKTFADGIRDMSHSLVSFQNTSGSVFDRVRESFANMLQRMAEIAAEQAIANPIIDALFGQGASGGGSGGSDNAAGGGGLFGKLLGSFSGGGAGGGLSGIFDSFLSIFHEGGIAGQASSTMSMPAALAGPILATAPRYHGGGFAGFRPGEVPAVLERGEEILTRRDPRHRYNLGRGGGGEIGARPSVTMNFYNPTRDMIPEIVQRVEALGVAVKTVDGSIERRAMAATREDRSRSAGKWGR